MYKYEDLKPKLFTEKGSVTFLKIRDNVGDLLKQAGAVRMQEAMSVGSGDSWFQMACVDRLVELGEIRLVTDKSTTAGQYQVYVRV